MRSLLSIDPGKKAIGAALWADGLLVRAFLSRAKGKDLNTLLVSHFRTAEWERVNEVAIEVMRYRAQDGRSRPNDLLDVQAIGMAVAGRVGDSVRVYAPHEWKSALPKAVHHVRLIEALSDEERIILDRAVDKAPKAHHKEIYDAVGIGLFHLRRINLAGVSRR